MGESGIEENGTVIGWGIQSAASPAKLLRGVMTAKPTRSHPVISVRYVFLSCSYLTDDLIIAGIACELRKRRFRDEWHERRRLACVTAITQRVSTADHRAFVVDSFSSPEAMRDLQQAAVVAVAFARVREGR